MTNKMHYNVNDVFHSQFPHQHVSTAIMTIFRVILLQDYKVTNVVSLVAIAQ